MRSVQASKNALSSLISQILQMILSFITRTVFIYTLSSAYLGISGLFQSVLTVLNLTELGIGSSIIYALYKPIAEGNTKKIKALMQLYKDAYRIIGWIVLIIGIILMPFLDYIVKGGAELINLKIVFALYILDSVVSYWFFAYKRSLLEADQKKYVVVNATTIFVSLGYLLRILSLYLFKSNPEISYYVYMGIGTVGNIFTNIMISKKVDKAYPYLHEGDKEKLTKSEIDPILKNVTGVFVSKFSGIMINSVDNILISAFISISLVGVYSNYLTIRSYLLIPINIVFVSLSAGIGDFCARETIDKQESFFDSLQFLYFWVYGFASIGLWIVCNHFIAGVWLRKEEYLLSDVTVLLISLNFLLNGLAGAVISFRDAHGLYWKTKFRYLFSAVFNGILSFLLIKPLGVVGVLIGTTASILIMVLFDPIIVFKNVFHKSVKNYYLKYIKYLLVIMVTAGIVYILTIPYKDYNITNFIIRIVICMLVPNFLWFVLFRRSSEFVFLERQLKGITSIALSKIKKKA